MRVLWLLPAAVILSGVLAGSASAAVPTIHAHRGGAISFGTPDQYEDTLEAFERRIAQTPGVWLEMDAGVSSDGVPFVIHDSTLDRTTDCTGALLDRTAAEIDACEVDVLGVASGTPATTVPKPAGSPAVHVPRLAAVLAVAKQAGAPVNLEIKRIPGDPHYTPGDTSFATHVMDVVKAAKLDPAKLIIQSFDPTNLDVAKQQLPGVVTSFLALSADPASVALCTSRGYDWLSPGGVPDAATMALAKQAGIKVVPYTLDSAQDIRAAADAGVDAIITNDVPLARRTLGLGETPAVNSPAPTGGGDSTPAATPRTLKLSLLAARRATARRRGSLAIRLTAPAGAKVAVRLTTTRGTLLARTTVEVTRASARTVRVKLTSRGRRLLARSRKPLGVVARATLDGVAVDARRRLG